MKYFYEYERPQWKMIIEESNGKISQISFGSNSTGERKETPLIKRTMEELDEYFSGKRKEFDIPLETTGTEFQRKVWAALQTIPYGQTISYKELAEKAGSPKACRAVGGANHNNPIAIIIPCHRVIGANGSLVGYASGVEMKERLLKLEKALPEDGYKD